MPYSKTELNLFKQLIGRLMLDYSDWAQSNRSWEFDGSEHPSIKGMIFDHMFTNPFERAAYNFIKWGICRHLAIGDPPKDSNISAEFIVDLCDLSDHIDSKIEAVPPLSNSVSMFVSLYCSHHVLVPISREPFSMDTLPSMRQGIDFSRHPGGDRNAERIANYKPEMDRFVEAGYAEKSGNLYNWTTKIAPVMRKHYLWTEDSRYEYELKQEDVEIKALSMWNLMPAHISSRLQQEPPDKRKGVFMGLAANYWDEHSQCWVDRKLDLKRFGVTKYIFKRVRVLEDRGLL